MEEEEQKKIKGKKCILGQELGKWVVGEREAGTLPPSLPLSLH